MNDVTVLWEGVEDSKNGRKNTLKLVCNGGLLNPKIVAVVQRSFL
jgi:hypothetical protein